MRSVYIIGGSNSLLRQGWADQFTALATEIEVVNHSIGAATSLIGIYRLLRNEVPEGATVIWEYALNEHNHFLAGQSVESLMWHLDWFLELCARRRIAVLPLIFWNREEMADKSPMEYRDALQDCLHRHGLGQIDMKPILRQFSQTRDRPIAELYQDGAHYRLGSGVPRRIATAVRNRLAEARVPRGAETHRGLDLLIATPDRIPDERFSNKILDVDLFQLGEGLRIPADGSPLCCYLIAGEAGHPIQLHADGSDIGHYATSFPATKLKRLMKHIVLWGDVGDRKSCRTEITLRPGVPGMEKVQNTFLSFSPKRTGLREAVIGILIER